MFGMVLAIGLLVDDAIVVVENVERLIHTEGLSPKEAARKSMDEITGALVGIGMVLSAVFLPMAFFGGSAGVIYRQFSITIVSAMALSVLVALILTPALCATILKPRERSSAAHEKGFAGWFNRNFDRGVAPLRRGRRAGQPPLGADLRRLRPDRRRHGAAVRHPAGRLPAGRRPGLPVHPGDPADRRHRRADRKGDGQGAQALPGRREGRTSPASSPPPASASSASARTPASASPP